MSARTAGVVAEVAAERLRQFAKHGPQMHLPDGTGLDGDTAAADAAKEVTDRASAEGRVTFRHILAEEVAEAFAETDEEALRAELIQVAAVAVQWVEAIDARRDTPLPSEN